MGEHWYTRAGRPCHFQEKADGSGLRATTLADARKLNLVPSFSTVDSIRNKFQLNRYLTRDAVRLGFEMLHQDAFEDSDSYADRVMRLVEETKGERTGSDVGTEIHAALEACARGEDYDPEYTEHAEAAMSEVARLFPDVTDWVAEKTFANPMGFGGMIDLHSPSTGVAVDYKSKDFELLDGQPVRPGTDRKYRLDYDQNYQLGAYQRGLLLPRNVAASVFVSRCQPGAVTSRLWTLDELNEGWEIFVTELELWVAVKGYDPSFIPGEEEAAA